MTRFKTIALIILILMSTNALFAISNNTISIVMTAEIPETTVFSLNAAGLTVASNARNFSYTVKGKGNLRTLHVVAT